MFTKRPLNLNEKLVIQILKNDQLYAGNLGFGLTTCNPGLLTAADLPADSHKLLDRSEYWLVIKDVLVNAKAGDELGFTINNLNQVQLTKNNLPPVTLMHVDASQRFYAFFDLHGKTTKIQVLGTYHEPITVAANNQVQSSPFTSSQRLSHSNNVSNHYSECANRAVQEPKNGTLKRTPSPKPQSVQSGQSSAKSPEGTSSSGECTVCFEKNINCVLYQCGHMCMCYTCAIRQWQGVGGNGQCPICRAYICDVIRTYPCSA